jgi:hypothetical protein
MSKNMTCGTFFKHNLSHGGVFSIAERGLTSVENIQPGIPVEHPSNTTGYGIAAFLPVTYPMIKVLNSAKAISCPMSIEGSPGFIFISGFPVS